MRYLKNNLDGSISSWHARMEGRDKYTREALDAIDMILEVAEKNDIFQIISDSLKLEDVLDDALYMVEISEDGRNWIQITHN